MCPVAIFNVSGDVAFTILGAVVVAGFTGWLTAHTTNRRQERQLAHDRDEADRAERRDALDGAAAAAITAMRALVGASGAVDPTRYATANQEVLDRQRDYGRDKVQVGMEAVGNLTPHLGRLQLRLGARHDAVVLYRKLVDRGNEVLDGIPRELPGTAQQARDCDTAGRLYTVDMQHFIEACHRLVRSGDTAA